METCPSTMDLSAYFDDEASPTERAHIERHAAQCARCAATLRDWRSLALALRTDERLPVDLGPHLWARLHPTPRRLARWAFRFVPLSLGTTAALAAGIVLGTVLVHPPAPELPVGSATMALFDPVPPGGICMGRHCPPVGRL